MALSNQGDNKKTTRLVFMLSVLALALTACGSDSGSSTAAKPKDENPVVQPTPEPTPSSVSLKHVSRYSTGVFEKSAAEITAFDAQSKRVFTVNAQQGSLDIIDLSDANNPKSIGAIEVSGLATGATVNSVAVHNGIVAIAIESTPKTAPGYVAFYQAADSRYLSHVQVGALPDMLVFTPDGTKVLVANEGEPSDDYQIDPEGSISIIDISKVSAPTVRTADFTAFNDQREALLAQGVRLFGPDQSKPHAGRVSDYARVSVAQDVEPEYIAVSADGKLAWVSLQENNALAKVDIEAAKVIEILPLGFKDHGIEGQGMDVTDATTAIDIRTWPGVHGMYMPDAIAAYAAAGNTYIVTANEGDARAWGEGNAAYFNAELSQGFVEEIRVKHLVHKDGFSRRLKDDMPAHLYALAEGAMLDPNVFGYCGAKLGNKPGDCRLDEQLGRLKVTWTLGYKTKPDGTPLYHDINGQENPTGRWLMYDKLYSFGARSFSIRDQDGALVWDSGDQFEQFLASDECKLRAERDIPCATYFNSQHSSAGALKNRSDDKGPEPEGVELGQLGDKTFAFIGLERMGGIMVYDITDPTAPVFQDYLNTRQNWGLSPDTHLAEMGDLGPEGLKFIPAKDSPTGQPLLIVGFEVSGTTSVFEIEQQF